MPTAGAEPGIPGTDNASCESYGFGSTAMACDGPIRPDGSWRRCTQWQAQPVFGTGGFGNGGFLPGGSKCYDVDLGSIHPGTPGYHIDG